MDIKLEQEKTEITVLAIAITRLLQIVGIPAGEKTEKALMLTAFMAGPRGKELQNLSEVEAQKLVELELDYITRDR